MTYKLPDAYGYRDPVRRRYERDPTFRQLVDVLLMHLHKYEFSPTELREACMLAAVQFEMTQSRPYRVAIERGEEP
jgi:hypothetical protein